MCTLVTNRTEWKSLEQNLNELNQKYVEICLHSLMGLSCFQRRNHGLPFMSYRWDASPYLQ